MIRPNLIILLEIDGKMDISTLNLTVIKKIEIKVVFILLFNSLKKIKQKNFNNNVNFKNNLNIQNKNFNNKKNFNKNNINNKLL